MRVVNLPAILLVRIVHNNPLRAPHGVHRKSRDILDRKRIRNGGSSCFRAIHYSSCLFAGRSLIIPNIRLVKVISSCVNLEHECPAEDRAPRNFQLFEVSRAA